MKIAMLNSWQSMSQNSTMTLVGGKNGWSAKLCSRERLCLDGDTSEIVAEIDYTPISSSVVSPLWSSASTCDPLKDLKTAMRLVSGACGYSADLIVMGKDASDAFENADKVLAAYDKLNISPGVITPALAEYGITLLGNYRGLPLYASESQYTDVDGSSKYFVPADKVLVAASGLQGILAYAGIVQVDENESSMQPYEATRLPLVFYEKGYDFRKVRLSSRPIPVPADTQSWTFSTLSNIMPTYTLPSNLGDILGAHHDGNLQTQVSEIKSGIGVLKRGTILATGSGADIGKLVLLSATTEFNAYGVLLDPLIDTAATYSDGSVTGSIAKAGTLKVQPLSFLRALMRTNIRCA